MITMCNARLSRWTMWTGLLCVPMPSEKCTPGSRLWQTLHVRGALPENWTILPYSRRVSQPTSLVKRLLLGRPFRSDRLSETLLPKRIALPVFASDAMSSVAYAPAEILATLSTAGLATYALSPWVGVAVVVV